MEPEMIADEIKISNIYKYLLEGQIIIYGEHKYVMSGDYKLCTIGKNLRTNEEILLNTFIDFEAFPKWALKMSEEDYTWNCGNYVLTEMNRKR